MPTHRRDNVCVYVSINNKFCLKRETIFLYFEKKKTKLNQNDICED